MIKLNNGYSIISDGIQYKLIKPVIRTTKKDNSTYEDEEVIGYYGKLTQALRGYISHCMLEKVKDEELYLKDVKDALKQLEMEIKRYE